ncbi:arylesterase [Opitutales bacterium]|nr:arylesterase [Opitutales bacterium]
MTNTIATRIFILIILHYVALQTGCTSEPGPKNKSSKKIEVSTENIYRILILGDSLTEGYGVPIDQAFPSLLEEKLNSEFSSTGNKEYKIINAGISGSTTSGGVSRIDWLLKSQPDFLIIALGGNDGLRGVPVNETKKNLEEIILAAKDKKIPTLLTGMKIPPNYGIQYTEDFANLFPDLAKEQDTPLLPFLLEGVGGQPSMNLPDRIHPNKAGHQKISETVFEYLTQNLP